MKKVKRRTRIITESSDEDSNDVRQVPIRRRSRVLSESTADGTNEDSNDVVAISLQEAVASVVLEVSANLSVEAGVSSEVETLVDGKKFPTTFLTVENEENGETSTDKSEVVESSADTNLSVNAEVVDKSNLEIEIDPIQETGPQAAPADQNQSVDSNMDISTAAEANVLDEATPSAEPNEQIAQITQSNQPTETIASKPEKDDAQNELPQPATSSTDKLKPLAKKNMASNSHRNSLPGIDRMPKKILGRKANRVSLGDLDLSRQVRIAPVAVQLNEPMAMSRNGTVEEPTEQTEEATNVNNESSSSIESTNSNAENIPLNNSSQEENNNQKSERGI